jgi:sortase A
MSTNSHPSRLVFFSRLRVSPSFCLAAILIAVGLAFTGEALFIRAKAAVAQILLERAWAATLATHQPTKPWSWADTWPVARLAFPRLDRSAVVLNDGGGEALAFGPAHVAASAKPGANGTTVIAAHRDTHFDFIKDLRPGDAISLTTRDGTTLRYVMTGSAIVHAQASGIAAAGPAKRLALVTCYPFDGLQRGPLRYVVFAEAQGD